MLENLKDSGRNIRADVSRRTPDLGHATELADRYGDTRTANQMRAMDNASGRMSRPPSFRKKKRGGTGR